MFDKCSETHHFHQRWAKSAHEFLNPPPCFTYTAADAALSYGKWSRKRTAIVSSTSTAELLNYTTHSSVRRIAIYWTRRFRKIAQTFLKAVHYQIYTCSARFGSVTGPCWNRTLTRRLHGHIQWTGLTKTRRDVNHKDFIYGKKKNTWQVQFIIVFQWRKI